MSEGTQTGLIVFLLLQALFGAWLHFRDAKNRLREAEERLAESTERAAYWAEQKKNHETLSARATLNQELLERLVTTARNDGRDDSYDGGGDLGFRKPGEPGPGEWGDASDAT